MKQEVLVDEGGREVLADVRVHDGAEVFELGVVKVGHDRDEDVEDEAGVLGRVAVLRREH